MAISACDSVLFVKNMYLPLSLVWRQVIEEVHAKFGGMLVVDEVTVSSLLLFLIAFVMLDTSF